MRKPLLLIFTLLAVFAVAALAHHGWTGYDENKTLIINGTIKDSSYSNPHAMIHLTADDKEGKTWNVYLAPPSRMSARGLEKDAIQPGTKATVVGYPSKANADELRAETITISGKNAGKPVELR